MSWTLAYSIASPAALLIGGVVALVLMNAGVANLRRGRAMAPLTTVWVDCLVRVAMLPVTVASVGVERTLAPFYRFMRPKWPQILEQMHAIRTKPPIPPPNTDGGLFERDELDIGCGGEFKTPHIFHGKAVDYTALAYLEYYLDDNWVVVVMKDDRRLDLGVQIQSNDRPYWESATEIVICRTREGHAIEHVFLPLRKQGS